MTTGTSGVKEHRPSEVMRITETKQGTPREKREEQEVPQEVQTPEKAALTALLV